MTHFRNCMNCLHEKSDCTRRLSLAAGLKGLGVTSVKFRCSARMPVFSVGQRVSVWWPVPTGDTDDWGRQDFSQETWPATVVAERGNRFQIVVDDVESDHETPARDYIKSASLYCKVPSWRLAPLDEPTRAVCSVCQAVPRDDGTTAGCFGYSAEEEGYSGYRPVGCLRATPAQGIEARSDETPQAAQPEGQEPGGEAMRTVEDDLPW
jgi:hypothetical protein